jgi:uncharacterized protein YodC (DUF2158 family)
MSTPTDGLKDEFARGDLVQLKSGGPKMTLCHGDGRYWWCRWFEGQSLRSEEFSSESLVRTA